MRKTQIKSYALTIDIDVSKFISRDICEKLPQNVLYEKL